MVLINSVFTPDRPWTLFLGTGKWMIFLFGSEITNGTFLQSGGMNEKDKTYVLNCLPDFKLNSILKWICYRIFLSKLRF